MSLGAAYAAKKMGGRNRGPYEGMSEGGAVGEADMVSRILEKSKARSAPAPEPSIDDELDLMASALEGEPEAPAQDMVSRILSKRK